MNVARETPIGTRVRVHRDNGETLETVTRSAPWHIGGRLVVQVKGIAGCYMAERCEVIGDL
jgi:hypothetical protein